MQLFKELRLSLKKKTKKQNKTKQNKQTNKTNKHCDDDARGQDGGA